MGWAVDAGFLIADGIIASVASCTRAWPVREMEQSHPQKTSRNGGGVRKTNLYLSAPRRPVRQCALFPAIYLSLPLFDLKAGMF